MGFSPPPGYGAPPGYGPPPVGYGAPPGFGPRAPITYSDKTLSTAFIISYFLGFLGVDRFYLGQVGLGVLKLVTCGGVGLWYFIDLVLLALGSVKDGQGLPLKPPPSSGQPTVNGHHVLVASVLAGQFGVDRFLLGQTGLGVIKLITCGGFGIWTMIDTLLIASGSVKDAQGNGLAWDKGM